ncbi:hypothetical protein JXA02_14395, partial [candidate division KSB1 bacterium]|nr:hypothetical protein [candidate division KSB1 bacterium]
MKTAKAIFLKLGLTLCTPFLLFAQPAADELGWPKEIQTQEGAIVIYQPQPESFVDDKLEARAAVAVKPAGQEEPVFGAIWFTARVATDTDERIVTLMDMQVADAKFPAGEKGDAARLSRFAQAEISKWQLTMSLDQLLTSLDTVETEEEMAANFNNAPPEIIYRSTPSVLVLIDGEPRLQAVENSDLDYVVNTPFLIIKEKSRYYLFGGGLWYRSRDIMGDWQHIELPPSAVAELAEDAFTDEEKEERRDAEASGIIPKIIVRTEPAELIQSNGEPEYAAIDGTSLLYMSNSENDIVMDINTQTYFVLLAGRWYTSKSLLYGPWFFIPNDDLPQDFALIGEESQMATVLPSVAGTQQSRDALLENTIPQTAVVDRKTASLRVDYDGDPRFLPIENSNMSYAVNTDKSVLKIDGRYYCCDDAVWFVGVTPKGPWEVCTDVPDEVQDIPPDVPVYNVKYVYIYDYTPEVIYVGYTPGYVHSYVYRGCVVYGTGWHYRPWHGRVYYPRPVTWGFNVHYNPWTGWGFSWGYSVGWIHVGYGHWRPPYYGWWGPAGYYPGYRHGYYHGYHHGYWDAHRQDYYAEQRPMYEPRHANIYRRRETGVRETVDPRRPSPTADRRRNDVYVDRDGAVHRRTESGWQQRQDGRWQDSDGTSSRTSEREVSDRQRESQTRDQSRQPVQRPERNTQQPTTRDQGGRQPAQRESARPPAPQREADRTRRSTPRDGERASTSVQRDRQQTQREAADPQRNLERESINRARGQQRTSEYQSQRRQSSPPSSSQQRQPSSPAKERQPSSPAKERQPSSPA